MAFNLNKTGGAASSTRFDLSKDTVTPPVATEPEKPKSKSWLFILALVLVAGIAAWYFLPGTGAQPENTSSADSAKTGNGSANTISTTATADTSSGGGEANNSTTTNTGKSDNATNPTGDVNHSGSAAAVSSESLNNTAPATFEKGSNAIRSMDKSLLKDILGFLQKNPGSVIYVNGYASSEGDLAVNQQISQSRADAFKNYLVTQGVAAGRINASGKGIGNPVSTNDTEEGRARNRRVEVVFQ